MNPHKVVKVHKCEKFLRKLIMCYKILSSNKLMAVTQQKGQKAEFCSMNMEFKEISDAAEKIYLQTFDKAKNVSSSFNNEIVNNLPNQ